MSEHGHITPSDCVYYKGPDGDVMSCGFKIDSELLNSGHPVMSVGGKKDKGDNVSDIFRDLVVPIGLLCTANEDSKPLTACTLDSDVVSKSLFDKLVEMASVDSEPRVAKKQTRSNKSSSSKAKTRKRKS